MKTYLKKLTALLLTLLLALMLAACGDNNRGDAAQRAAREAEDGLPAPSGTGGVTGTPDVAPGPGSEGPLLGGIAPPAPAEEVPTGDPLLSGEVANPETGLGMDPDGDGFVCGWDPRPYRQSGL